MRVLTSSIIFTTNQAIEFDGLQATDWTRLSQLVEDAIAARERIASDDARAGKKRQAPDGENIHAKRRKLSSGSRITATSPLSNVIPVFREEFRVKYKADRSAEVGIASPHWAKLDSMLYLLHEKYSQEEEDVVLELSPCDVKPRSNQRFWVQAGSYQPLLSLPSISSGGSNGNLYTTYLSFQLHVDITLSFITPYIFKPEPIPSSAHLLKRIEDVRARLLQLAFPSAPLCPTVRKAYQGRIDIPFFYASINSAPALSSSQAYECAQPCALLPALLPFQRRTVAWMLEKEGKRITKAGDIIDVSSLHADARVLPPMWERLTMANSEDEMLVWYYHRLSATLTTDFPAEEFPPPGAILAEEPGLGKTLECISLILLNPGTGRNPSESHWDANAELNVKQVQTTLIVTPASLIQQWVDEIRLHSPSLRVLVYNGWTKLPKHVQHSTKNSPYIADEITRSNPKPKGRKKGKRNVVVDDDDNSDRDMGVNEDAPGPVDWATYLNSFDVCITTYNVLQQDLNVARAPPKRPRRETAEYSRTLRIRSPLVCVEFFRVIMDEVQMVGGGRTLEMVSLIPRYSSFAVSGTPARHQVSDLAHILNFLRADPLIYESRAWSRLLGPDMISDFVNLFQYYAVRTTKTAVKDELTIPQQTRYLVSIELGRVERHVYDQQMEKCLQELGLDARGVPATENWEIDTALLRTWLRGLRMICTHPQVGQLNKASDKTNKPGVLKSMSDVLDGMRDQNWRTLMDSRRQKVNEMARAAQLIQHHNTTDLRHKRALEILTSAEEEARSLIDDIKAAVAEHDEKGEVLRREFAARWRSQRVSGNSDQDKGKAHADLTDSDPEDEDANGLPRTPAGEDHRHKKPGLQNRLRDAYLSLHRVKFLQGDVHHVLGSSHEADEDAAYAAAEGLRKELLKITEDAALAAMTQLSRTAIGNNGFVRSRFLIKTPLGLKGGIRSAGLMAEANELIDECLNAQTELLWQWREHIHGLLTQPLNAAESDAADGQEYSRSLTTQGDAEVYLQVYSALLADRREILVAERTALAAHESRENKKRKTAAAAKAAAAAAEAGTDNFIDDAELEILDDGDVEIQPEHEVLHKELNVFRRNIMAKSNGRAVKSIVVQLASLSAKIGNDKDPEKVLAKEGAAELRKLIAEQARLNESLENDLARFRKAFNERILYFRQLQEISDTVMEAEWDGYIEDAVQQSNELLAEMNDKIKTARARRRYLSYLAQEGAEEEDYGCILCRCEFKRGFLTECAHAFCEDCMKSWLGRYNKACPVCRVPIHADNLQRFSVQPKAADDAGPPEKLLQGGKVAVPRSRRKIDYNLIPHELFEEIESMESAGSYGSKIQTLVRHLLYLQIADPGAKSIVFSAFQDSLHIVEHALNANGISCLRIDDGQGSKRKQPAAVRFAKDLELQVLLLHGERENAGLNVTCASRVFLLESVVHHSFEIQAIARIDRMGQSRPTEVFCYYAEETVEKNILDLAARQGLSLYTKEAATGTLDVVPLAPDSERNVVDAPAKKKLQKGDFIFKLDDMMSILFPHLVEDLEYLLPPPEEDVSMDREMQQPGPVAGPSRLAPLS
ncbi:SNF2 family N-terminal domain-containing protein [Vararia minispora EC-137]|uniref:SNF2 family N-terminal domain-containing protein n=1 Tax=Vararia minispora EC-137 TaxID=1314806 RepID=A0ACB8QVK7_9AGAM|nr:SNF2 family N-terminal domain-containing protein [Vararia minispora EC-137]